MNENGSIRIQPADGSEEIARDAFPSFLKRSTGPGWSMF